MTNPAIKASRTDVAWSFIGTVVTMGSGFILLPILMKYLSDEELGLWYVYLSIANLAMMFEFGFNPTFARNIVYVVSGSKGLSAEGRGSGFNDDDVDWHLLNVVIRTSKLIYACIAAIVFFGLAVVGTPYILSVTSEMRDSTAVWPSWSIFVLAIVINLYFLYTASMLRGYGDIAAENRVRTLSKIAQLAFSALALFFGMGLIGASLGYLVNSLLLRVLSIYEIGKHGEIEKLRKLDGGNVALSEIKETIKPIAHLAWRDGVVQLSSYVSSQGMSIMSSLYLGLAETGTYSVLLQLTNGIYGFACAYPKSFLPAMQSAFAQGDNDRQVSMASSGLVAYWALYVVGALGVGFVIIPLLPLLKPEFNTDYCLYALLCIYVALLQHHSIVCCFIIGMNEIPYMAGYLVAAILGMAIVYIFCAVLGWGAYGIVLGEMLAQALYNNWKWPAYYCSKIGVSYCCLLNRGAEAWIKRIQRT